MSDFFESGFANKGKTRKVTVQKKRVNNILYSNSDTPDLYILVDEYLSENTCNLFYRSINKIWLTDLKKESNLQVKIIYGFKHKVDKEADIKNNKGWYYYDNKIDFSEVIPKGSKVITIGDAIYFATNGNTDINVESFLDFILNETSFYSPLCKSQVYPIYDMSLFFGKDNFEHFFSMHNIKKCMSEVFRMPRIPELKLEEIDDLDKFLFDNLDKKEVAIDLETNGFSYLDNEIICMSISFDGVTGYYLDWNKADVRKLNDFLKDKFIIGNNLTFDFKFLIYRGLTDIKIGFDNWNAGHIVNESRSNSLKSQSFYFTYYGDYEIELELFKRKNNPKHYGLIPKSTLKPYAIMDSIISYQCYKQIQKRLKQLDEVVTSKNDKITPGYGVVAYYENIVMPAVNLFIDVSMTGIKVDWNILDEQANKLDIMIAETKRKLSDLLGVNNDFDFDYDETSDNVNFFTLQQEEDLNLNSGDKIGKLLEEKHFPEVERNKKGIYCVNDASLNKWTKCCGIYKEVAETIIYLHEINTLQKTFVKGFKQYKNSKDDRIHSNFHVALTESGRSRSSNPNGQNYPARGWKAEMMKKFFVPFNKDYSWLSYDESGLQLRLSAMINDDPVFRDVFITKGGDMHSMTGSSVVLNNRVEFSEFVKLKKTDSTIKTARQKAKNINFGLLFGAKSQTISSTVIEPEWSDTEVKEYIKQNKLSIITDRGNKEDEKLTVANAIRNNFFSTYCGLEKHLVSTTEKAKQDGYVQSIYGQIRRLPYLLYCSGADDNMKRVSNFENISVNTYIQGMEAVVMLRITIKLYNWLKENNMKTKIVSAIHDALEVMIYKPEAKKVIEKTELLFKEYYPEFNGINIEGEGNIADYYLGHNVIVKDKETKEVKNTYWTNTLWDMGIDPKYYLKCIEDNIIPEVIIFE